MKRAKHLENKRALKEIGFFLLDILYNAVVIIALVALIRTFLISPFRVIGSSMADTLHNNEFILIDKLSYHLSEPKRGDAIVFLPPITNKNAYKFKTTITTDNEGVSYLDISSMKTEKKVFYCQNPWIKKLWVCEDKVSDGDYIYYYPSPDDIGNDDSQIQWEEALKRTVLLKEVQDGVVKINGLPNQNYLVRIYNSNGPEYFVKRVIGVPGDLIRIENGRVYLKPFDKDEFTEIDEFYLNQENRYSTYFRKTDKTDEIKVPVGKYFVMGDNRNHSNDSRHWFSPLDEEYTPYVEEDSISGKVLIVLWPPQDLRLIKSAILTEY